MASALSLPDEVLINIFEVLATNILDTPAAYADLRNLQLTCKQWEGAAHEVLYKRVEVAKAADADALERTILEPNSGPGGQLSRIETLVVGIAEREKGIMGPVQLQRLLQRVPGIRRLVICLDGYYSPQNIRVWNFIAPSVLDVTIISSSASLSSATAASLVFSLPSQVRFLQLLCNFRDGTDSSSFPPDLPSFELYGLTTEEYSSDLADWVLSSSGQTLRLLTVVVISNLPRLSTNHPNLRSLRILTPRDPLTPSFATFYNLERLEIRSVYYPASTINTLPICLKYIRFWSSKVAAGLLALITTSRWRVQLPNLETIVYDYWVEDGVEAMMLVQLEDICREEGLTLRTYERTNEGMGPAAQVC